MPKMSDTDPSAFWDQVYLTKDPTRVSWFQADYDAALAQIEALNLSKDAAIIDIGAGRSGLAMALSQAGYIDISALDISAVAVEAARQASMHLPHAPTFICADLRDWSPARHYDLWHDRAVFHFLTDDADQSSYLDSLIGALTPQAHVLISCFHEDGPKACSGLEVQRYTAESLAARMGARFVLRAADLDHHITPSGQEQLFLRAHLQLRG